VGLPPLGRGTAHALCCARRDWQALVSGCGALAGPMCRAGLAGPSNARCR
jgi:hypothetical protein